MLRFAPSLFRRLSLFFLLFLQVPSLYADLLILTNGSVMEGKVTEDEGGYWIENDKGARSLVPRYEVRAWVPHPTKRELYEAKAAALPPDDADGHLELGFWCRRNGLPSEAQWHFMMAVALRPEDPKARRAAGFVWDGKEWLTMAEFQERQGKVLYQGRWIPREEAAEREIRESRAIQEKERYVSAWKTLFSARDLDPSLSLDPIVEALVPQGSTILPVVERGYRDFSPRVREASLHILGRLSCDRSRKLLLQRLREEGNLDLRRIAAEECARRTDRMAVLTDLLQLAIQSSTATIRRRAALGLLALADIRAIDVLVPAAEFCPVDHSPSSPSASAQSATPKEKKADSDVDTPPASPPTEVKDKEAKEKEATEKEAKEKEATEKRARELSSHGKQVALPPSESVVESSDHPPPRRQKPYYPAAEVLRYLTRQNLPPSRPAWEAWWKANRSVFVFRKIEPEDL